MNQHNNIVIIGCGAGGGTSSQFARKTDRKSEITIFEKGKYPQYSKCGLPYSISGDIDDYFKLIEFSEDWFEKAKIDILLDTEVTDIDVNDKIVKAKRGNSLIEKSYSSLIIATGSYPFIPAIKDIKKNGTIIEGILTLRTIDDAKKISNFIIAGKRATIIGAGLIGLEMADCLYKRGMEVTVIESLPTILPNIFDEDMSHVLHSELSKKINLITNQKAIRIFNRNGRISRILIKNNDTLEEKYIDTDLLIIATGTIPEIGLAKKAGCKIGKTGNIIVNNKSETSIKDIYAVGDCTEYIDFITKKPIPIGLGSMVVRQAIAAGVNSAGGNYELPNGFLQTCTSDLFGIQIGAVGPLLRNNKEVSYISGKYNGLSLPEYFPGGKPILIKVFVEKNLNKIIAAQSIGDNAAQRINTIACAIFSEMDVNMFRKLETAYAPPVAPTLDSITLACDVVSMKLKRRR